VLEKGKVGQKWVVGKSVPSSQLLVEKFSQLGCWEIHIMDRIQSGNESLQMKSVQSSMYQNEWVTLPERSIAHSFLNDTRSMCPSSRVTFAPLL